MSFFSGQVQTLLRNNFLTLKITITRTSIHAGIFFSKWRKKDKHQIFWCQWSSSCSILGTRGYFTQRGVRSSIVLWNDFLLTIHSHLSKRHVMEVLVIECEAEFLAQSLYVLQWIDTWGQDEEDWGPRPALLVRLCKLHLTIFHIFCTHLFFHKAAV